MFVGFLERSSSADRAVGPSMALWALVGLRFVIDGGAKNRHDSLYLHCVAKCCAVLSSLAAEVPP